MEASEAIQWVLICICCGLSVLAFALQLLSICSPGCIPHNVPRQWSTYDSRYSNNSSEDISFGAVYQPPEPPPDYAPPDEAPTEEVPEENALAVE